MNIQLYTQYLIESVSTIEGAKLRQSVCLVKRGGGRVRGGSLSSVRVQFSVGSLYFVFSFIWSIPVITFGYTVLMFYDFPIHVTPNWSDS